VAPYRLIHTADWHIGQMLAGHARAFEHARAFASLRDIMVQRDVHGLLVAGDVLDTQNPSAAAMAQLYATLVMLKRALPDLAIILTVGNHDSAGRIEAARPLLAPMGIRVIGNIDWRDGCPAPEKHLLPLLHADGSVAADVLAVSFPTSGCLPPLASTGAEGGSPVVQAIRSLYRMLDEGTRPSRSGRPLIVTGHLHVAGGLESEGAERRILIGGEHIFPADAAYVALGHLHKPQWIGGRRVRYSGSLFPLSATERDYDHGVTLLTIVGDTIESEHVPLPRPTAFHRLPERGDVPLDGLAGALTAMALDVGAPLEERPYLQVRLTREGLPPDFREEAERIIAGFPVRLIELKVAAAEAPADAAPATAMARLADLDTRALFLDAFRKRHQREAEAAHLEAFHIAMTEA
jgi:DNA repair protein SbcD/Mre11